MRTEIRSRPRVAGMQSETQRSSGNHWGSRRASDQYRQLPALRRGGTPARRAQVINAHLQSVPTTSARSAHLAWKAGRRASCEPTARTVPVE